MRTSWNPPNPWEAHQRVSTEPEAGAALEVREEDARSALTRNDSPDLPFRWTLNPYRGCQHACAYCYARPTHQYLGLGAGTDFEKRIIVKRNLPALLARELARPSWKGEPISISGVTDPYQPIEARHRLTRRCLEVCLRHANPVTVVTKGVLVARDVDLLSELARTAGARVFVSIPLFEAEFARALEPGAPSPRERLETLRCLSRAGVPCGLALAPFVPRLGESRMGALIRSAAEAGARHAFLVLLRLPAEVLPVFRKRLEETLPERAAAILQALTEMRAGHLQETRFGTRLRGEGQRVRAIQGLFEALCRKHGLHSRELDAVPADRPRPRQGELFSSEPSP